MPRQNINTVKSLLCVAALLSMPLMTVETAFAAMAPEVKAPQVNTPKRVLFVGNSYLYYGDSLHNHVGRLAVAGNPALAKALQYKSATIGGANLAHHNIDHLTEPGRIGVKEPFELVILQDGSAAPLSEKRRALSMEKIREYSELIRKRGGQVALYMNHVYVPPHKQAKPENIRLTEAHYLAAGNAVKALIIPVGLAFEEAYRRKPDMKLHKDFDGTHPELIGTYLAACVVYASIYGKSPVGNSYDYYGKVSKEDAAFLQQVAEDTVKKFYGR
ncbi:MAG: DUF4886 domain-containing protein [Burkholderiales bacterium]